MTNPGLDGKWRGIIPPLVTPLVDYDTLDIEALERVIENVVSAGVSGIFVLGSTGEGPNLSYRLRGEAVRYSCRFADGRVPVLACITDTSYVETVRLAAVAAEAGATAVVAATPYYFYMAQSDLLHYVDRLTGEIELPLFLYNMPNLTKVAFEVATVKEASRNPRVIGIKDSSGDMRYLGEVVKAVSDRSDFSVMIGPEEKLAEAMRLGCSGGVTGGGNLNPALFVKIYQAAVSGNWSEADRLQEVSRSMSRAIYGIGNPETSYLRGLKSAMALAGLCRPVFAEPFTPFGDVDAQVLRERFASLEIM